MFLSYLASCNASLCLFYSRSSAIYMCELYFVCLHMYLLSALQGTLWALLLVQVIVQGTLYKLNFHQVAWLALKMWLVLWTPQTILPLSRWHPKRLQRNLFFRWSSSCWRRVEQRRLQRWQISILPSATFYDSCEGQRQNKSVHLGTGILPETIQVKSSVRCAKVIEFAAKNKRSGVWILSLLHQLENTLKWLQWSLIRITNW